MNQPTTTSTSKKPVRALALVVLFGVVALILSSTVVGSEKKKTERSIKQQHAQHVSYYQPTSDATTYENTTTITTTELQRSEEPQQNNQPSALLVEPQQVNAVVEADDDPSDDNEDVWSFNPPKYRGHEDTKFYFLHIPKTAGTSMVGFLGQVERAAHMKDDIHGLTTNFSNWQKYHPTLTVYSSEGGGFHQYKPPNAFSMVRDPFSHVVSQYHQCTESIIYRKMNWTKTMPRTLLEWLQGWDRIQQKEPRWWTELVGGISRAQDSNYNCLVPLDLQSYTMDFLQTKRELSSTFFAVGLSSQFDLSACLFLAHIKHRVPGYCNCTLGRPAAPLKLYKPKISHGVRHHGNSYKLSNAERELIDKFTQKDQKLYKLIQQEFGNQVKWTEDLYKVKLCKSLHHKPAARRPVRHRRHVAVTKTVQSHHHHPQ